MYMFFGKEENEMKTRKDPVMRMLTGLLALLMILAAGDRICFCDLHAESYVLGSEDLSETEEEIESQEGMDLSEKATVIMDNTPLYADQEMTSVISNLRKGQVLEITRYEGMWCQVQVEEFSGYCMEDCLHVHSLDYDELVEYGKGFVGNPYVWGGTSLTKGCDCSAFIMRIYEHFGVSIPRSSFFQQTAGVEVKSLEDAQPGDIICYQNHVAMYIGDDKILHAKGTKSGIVITNGADYRKILSIRRIF